MQNRQGKTRLSKWYVPAPDDQEKFRLEHEIHRLVISRDAKHTNFIEFRSYKLIYRRYAGLFFILGVDLHANELLSLETIHLFVELLDQQFSNVCELDIVFNFNKVRLFSKLFIVDSCLKAKFHLAGLFDAGRVHSWR